MREARLLPNDPRLELKHLTADIADLERLALSPSQEERDFAAQNLPWLEGRSRVLLVEIARLDQARPRRSA